MQMVCPVQKAQFNDKAVAVQLLERCAVTFGRHFFDVGLYVACFYNAFSIIIYKNRGF